MSFRRCLLASLIIFSSLFLGCAPPWEKDGGLPLLKDTALDPGILIIGAADVNCLAGAPEQVQRYFQGTATEGEVDQFWKCSAKALKQFVNYFEGTAGGHYGDSQLRAFLEMYFLGGLKISDSLLTEMMRLKTLFFGGSIKFLTTVEVSKMVATTEDLRILFQKMRPHMGVVASLFDDEKSLEVPWERMENISKDFSATAAHLAQLLGKTNQTYSLAHINKFLLAMSDLENQKAKAAVDPWYTPLQLERTIRMLRLMRQILTARFEDEILPNEWNDMFQLGVRIMTQWMRYRFSLHGKEWPEVSAFIKYGDFGNEIFDLMEVATNAQKNKVVPFKLLTDFLGVLGELSMVPFNMRTGTAQDLIYALTQSYFRDISRPEGDPFKYVGLSYEAVLRARLEYQIWIRNQMAIYNELGVDIPKSLWGMTAEMTPEFKNLMHSKYRLLIQRKGGVLDFDKIAQDQAWDTYSLSQLNWRQAFVRLVVRGYVNINQSDPEERARAFMRLGNLQGLTRSEFFNFYRDIHAFAEDIEILDPREKRVASIVFDQGNFFTLGSVADRLLSLQEGVELITYAQSTAGANHRNWQKLQEQIGQLPGIQSSC